MAKKSKLRILLYVLLSLTVIIFLILTFAGRYMLGFSLTPDPGRRDIDSTYSVLYHRFPDMKPWVDSVLSAGKLKDTFVVMPDGRKLHSYFMGADDAGGRTAVVVHGYKDSAIKYFYLCRMYNRDLNYNVLMPELHAHGLSDGEHIQMGWKDADDVLQWIRIADEIFRDKERGSAMVVHGVSMGAATTMNVSAKTDLPDYVNAFIEDCGYTSVWDEFSMQLKEMFGLPAFPLMHWTSGLCSRRLGWNFKEASPLQSVSKCTKPMLFIHGDGDTFVPFSMFQPLFDAKPEPKDSWVAPGSEHAKAYKDYPQEYTAKVRDFLNLWNNH